MSKHHKSSSGSFLHIRERDGSWTAKNWVRWRCSRGARGTNEPTSLVEDHSGVSSTHTGRVSHRWLPSCFPGTPKPAQHRSIMKNEGLHPTFLVGGERPDGGCWRCTWARGHKSSNIGGGGSPRLRGYLHVDAELARSSS